MERSDELNSTYERLVTAMSPGDAADRSAGGQRHTVMQTSATGPMVLPLGKGDAPLEQAGGKGASLIRMTAAGLPVPPGFILSTEAYRHFLNANDLAATIAGAVETLSDADPSSWKRAATTIQASFEQATVP